MTDTDPGTVLIDSRQHRAVQCRLCGSVVWTTATTQHLADHHPEHVEAELREIAELRAAMEADRG